MKNLILGIIIGVCITSLGMWAYSSFVPDDSDGISEDSRLKPADKNKIKPNNLSNKALGRTEDESAGKALSKADRQEQDKQPDPSEVAFQDMLKGDISTAVQSFSGIMSDGMSSWRTLAQEIRGLKEKGEEGIAELVSIIEGDGSGFFKMIAADVLGDIFSETQDPKVKQILEIQVLSTIQNILDSESNMRLKRQAVNTLGELGIQEAQDMLVDILLDDTNQWMQFTSMRVLREKGNSETASYLVDMLQSSQDISHIMLAAGTLGKMNDHLNDPLVNEALLASVPTLKKIIEDDSQTLQSKRNALMTLGALGTPTSIAAMIKVAEEQAGKDSGLDRAAVWSWVRNGDLETAENLSKSLSNSDNDEARILFASAIGGLANRYIEPVAHDLAQSIALPTLKSLSQIGKNSDIQKKAIYALGRVGTNQDIEFLQQIAQTNMALQPTADQAIKQIQNRQSGQGRRFMGRFMGP